MTSSRATPSATGERHGPLWRVAFAGTLLAAMAASAAVQFTVGTLAPFMASDLGLTRADLGLLTTVFFAVGAAGSPVAGWFVDRLGGRRSLFILAGSAAIGTSILSQGTTLAVLMAGACIAGGGVALGNPSTNQLIAAHLPPGRQGVVVGVKQSGVQVSSFLAGLLLPSAALLFGWRWAFLTVVAIPLLCALGAWFAVPRHEDGPRGDPRRKVRIRDLDPLVWWLAGYALLMGVGTSIVGVFVVIYGVESLGMPEALAGGSAAVVGMCGIVARIAWGRAAERMRSTTWPLLALAFIAVVSTTLLLAAQTAGVWLIWPAAAGLGISAAAWNSVVMLSVVRDFPRHVSGTASGVVQGGFLLGLVSSPVLFGWSVDVTGTYTAGWIGVAASFAVAGGLALVWSRNSTRRARA